MKQSKHGTVIYQIFWLSKENDFMLPMSSYPMRKLNFQEVPRPTPSHEGDK